MIPPRFLRITSLTFSLWRCRSRSARRWRSQASSLREKFGMVGSFSAIQQRSDIAEQVVSRFGRIALLAAHALHHLVHLLKLFGIRRFCAGSNLYNIFEVCKQLLLDGLAEAFVGGYGEGKPASRQRANRAHNALSELSLLVFRDIDLLFYRAHQRLVRVNIFSGYRMLHLLVIAVGFDVINVVIEKGFSRFLVGVDEGALHLFFGIFIELFTHLINETEQLFALFFVVGVFGNAVA